MSLFSSIGDSFKQVFTNPGKANIGQIATVTGLLGGAATGVAAYGASKTSVGTVQTINGVATKVYDSGVQTPVGQQTSFTQYLEAGTKALATNSGDILKASGSAVYGGVKAAAGGIYSGGGTVLSSIFNSPSTIAQFLGQALPQILSSKPGISAPSLNPSAITSGASKFYDALNGGQPGQAPAETGVATAAPAGTTDSPANAPQLAGFSGIQLFLLIGLAVTVGFTLLKKKK